MEERSHALRELDFEESVLYTRSNLHWLPFHKPRLSRRIQEIPTRKARMSQTLALRSAALPPSYLHGY